MLLLDFHFIILIIFLDKCCNSVNLTSIACIYSSIAKYLLFLHLKHKILRNIFEQIGLNLYLLPWIPLLYFLHLFSLLLMVVLLCFPYLLSLLLMVFCYAFLLAFSSVEDCSVLSLLAFSSVEDCSVMLSLLAFSFC